MKKVNYILAAGLMQQENIITNLAQAIETCPNLGAFLADPQKPNPTFEEVQAKVCRYWSDNNRELLEFEFFLSSDFSWRCSVKYQYPVFYASEADKAAENSRYSCTADEKYTVPGIHTDSSTMDW